jgi:hypothetical protein
VCNEESGCRIDLFVVRLLAVAVIAEAQQQGKVFRVGIATSNSDANKVQVEAFRQGLRSLGYVEGNNILMEYRFLEGNPDVYSKLVVEMVGLKPDVMVILDLFRRSAPPNRRPRRSLLSS